MTSQKPNLEFVARIDVAPAKRELDKLRREGRKTSSFLSRGVKSAIRAGMNATGLDAMTPGNLLRTGAGAVRSAITSSFSDIYNESNEYMRAHINEVFTGDMDDKSRAAAITRNMTKDMFQYQIANNGNQVPMEAYDFYNHHLPQQEALQKARSKVEQDKEFYGPGMTDLAGDLFSRITGSIEAGFNKLVKAMHNAISGVD